MRRILWVVAAAVLVAAAFAYVEKTSPPWYERIRYPLHYSEYIRVHAKEHNLDPALMAALSSPVRYIGAIGSRTTNTQRREALREQGATDEQLERIFAPIGLDIGATTPAEIALAVMAEIVAARRGRPGGHLKVTKGSPS